MRILFTTFPHPGHFQPLVPIARAAAAAGHEVAFACAVSYMPVPEALGFHAFPAGYDLRGRPFRNLFPGVRLLPQGGIGAWARPNLFVGFFATVMAPDLLAIAADWLPHLIVRESAEYGGCVAAEVLGIPHASVRSSARSFAERLLLKEALDRLRELNGLPPDPGVTMPFRYLHLAPEPPAFHLPDEEPIPTEHPLRPANVETGDERLPDWVQGLPGDRPTVYVTLGTVVSREPTGQALFGVLLEALRDEPLNVVVTVGRDNDPARWGPQPPHVHLARFIPQSRLLPYCDLVVNQAGFSTVTGVLNAGLPMVLLPIDTDQPYNAACCAALGVGIVVGADERTPAVIRAAVREVLATPSYRTNAERVRDEMAALPGPEHAVELLERLAVERRALIRAAT